MFWDILGAVLDEATNESEAERQRELMAKQHRQQMELEEKRMQTNKSAQRHETVMGILKCVDTLITVAGQNNNQ